MIAQELGLDVFIDDKPKNCTDVSSLGIPTLLFDANFNKEYSHSNVTRVYSWPQIEYEVKKLYQSKNKLD
ncbi:hypothetical protein D3C80_1774560 [compost metagenome]